MFAALQKIIESIPKGRGVIGAQPRNAPALLHLARLCLVAFEGGAAAGPGAAG